MAPKKTTPTIDWGSVFFVAIAGALMSTFIHVATIVSTPVNETDDPNNMGYVYLLRPPRTSFEAVLNKTDGQAYWALAQDPSLQHPEAFVGGYGAGFAQRPVLNYLLWAGSLGQKDWLPPVFVAVSALSMALFMAANSLLVQRRYPDVLPNSVLLLLLLPGAISGLILGPNMLSLGLAILGLYFWTGERPRVAAALACFAVATLTRDTAVVFPLMLAVHHAYTHRRLLDRKIVLLLSTLVPYVLWFGFVNVRFGAVGNYANVAFGPPFGGLRASIPQWNLLTAFTALLLVALLVNGFVRARRDVVMWIAGATVFVGIFMTESIWASWSNFGRVFLAAFVLPAYFVLPRRRAGLKGHGAVAPAASR